MRRDTRFQKNAAIAEAYNPYLADDDGEDDEEEEITAAEWNWGKKIVMVPNPWRKEVEESYDFDVTKSDKLFDFLLEKGQVKLPTNHVMLPPNFITLLLILLMSVEFSGNIYRVLFSKGSLNLIHLER